jgi:hypothetical protein
MPTSIQASSVGKARIGALQKSMGREIRHFCSPLRQIGRLFSGHPKEVPTKHGRRHTTGLDRLR